MKRSGKDVTIIGWGAVVPAALQAAGDLAKAGVDAEVVDLRTLVPLDLDAVLSSVAKTRRLVIVHSAVKFGGFGAEIAALVSERCFGELAAPVVRVGAAFTPVPRAGTLIGAHSVVAPKIVAAVHGVCR